MDKTFVRDMLKGAFDYKKPSIGIDVDGTIDQAPEFFSTLTHSWPGDIHIITMRNDEASVIKTCQEFDIKYTHIKLVNRFEEKSVYVKEHNICMFFDDMPEVLVEVGYQNNCCLIRNEGNFDFDEKKYVMSRKTVIQYF